MSGSGFLFYPSLHANLLTRMRRNSDVDVTLQQIWFSLSLSLLSPFLSNTLGSTLQSCPKFLVHARWISSIYPKSTDHRKDHKRILTSLGVVFRETGNKVHFGWWDKVAKKRPKMWTKSQLYKSAAWRMHSIWQAWSVASQHPRNASNVFLLSGWGKLLKRVVFRTPETTAQIWSHKREELTFDKKMLLWQELHTHVSCRLVEYMFSQLQSFSGLLFSFRPNGENFKQQVCVFNVARVSAFWFSISAAKPISNFTLSPKPGNCLGSQEEELNIRCTCSQAAHKPGSVWQGTVHLTSFWNSNTYHCLNAILKRHQGRNDEGWAAVSFYGGPFG